MDGVGRGTTGALFVREFFFALLHCRQNFSEQYKGGGTKRRTKIIFKTKCCALLCSLILFADIARDTAYYGRT